MNPETLEQLLTPPGQRMLALAVELAPTDKTFLPAYERVRKLGANEVAKAAVEQAMRVGIRAACRTGVLKITAGNYGGTLGPVHLRLHELLAQDAAR